MSDKEYEIKSKEIPEEIQLEMIEGVYYLYLDVHDEVALIIPILPCKCLRHFAIEWLPFCLFPFCLSPDKSSKKSTPKSPKGK